MKNYYIIDFDSTFTQVEALDELARISLTNNPDREKIYQEIERLTNLAMDGKISFRESLAGRILLLQANKTHLDLLVTHLKKKVSPSFNRNRAFFIENSENTLIVSGGWVIYVGCLLYISGLEKTNKYLSSKMALLLFKISSMNINIP